MLAPRVSPWRLLALCSLILLLSSCSTLSQNGPFAVRPTVTSLGVEDIRIGSHAIRAGLDPGGIASMLAASLDAGSLPPVQATLALGLGLPSGLPPMMLDGFGWALDVPGAEPVTGRYAGSVALTPGDDADLRLPVTFNPLGDGQRLVAMARLAGQLASRGTLPAGSELAITPGGISGLGMRLPAGMGMPTVRLSVGEDGSLQPQR